MQTNFGIKGYGLKNSYLGIGNDEVGAVPKVEPEEDEGRQRERLFWQCRQSSDKSEVGEPDDVRRR